MSKKKRKLGYSQYEDLLADAHRKLDLLVEKFQEFQTYFVGYVEFHGENIEFHKWMEERIKELEPQMKAKREDLAKEEDNVLANQQ